METKRTAIRSLKAGIVIVALAGVFCARGAFAATLSFSPSAGTYLSGRSFTVSVNVSSPDQPMNAAQGEISFPPGELEVLSVSKTNSILNLWVQDPTFSNYDGTVDFSGVAVNPGFQGNNGTVLTITFEAKSSGTAALSFLSSAVLANDGKGTNILTGTSGANFVITPSSAGTGFPTGGATPTPAISITSDPVIAKGSWYNINKITFDWSVPSNAEGVDYTISNDPNLQLPDVNQGLISQTSYDLSTFADGVWYFFVSFESGNAWSPPIKMAVMLDRTPPDPFVITRVDTDPADARPVFAWTAADEGSGINHYEVKIGNGDWFDASVIQNGSSSYMLPPQSPAAMRTLTVRAFDKAGNYTDATTNFSVIAPAVTCNPSDFSCATSLFFARWGELISLIFIVLVLILYGFLYYLLRWRRQSRKELQKFRTELEEDLRRVEEGIKKTEGTGGKIDLRQSYVLEEKRSLEKELRRITEEVKEELKNLKNDK